MSSENKKQTVLCSLSGGMYPGHNELDLTSLPCAGQRLGSESVRNEWDWCGPAGMHTFVEGQGG